MRYLSLFSGLEGATLAWEPLGWECAAVAEVEPAACAVLAHHYPDVPNLGDVTKVTEQRITDLGHIDVVIFGSPCQDVSIAGKRAGMKRKAQWTVLYSNANYSLVPSQVCSLGKRPRSLQRQRGERLCFCGWRDGRGTR